MKNYLILITALFISTIISAQTGNIRGTIYDENGEAAVFATIQVENTDVALTSDLDGKFDISIEAGTYNVIVSYVGYEANKIEDVVVKPNEVTTLDVNLKVSAVVIGGEVLKEAKAITNTDVAMTTLQSKAAMPLDGLSNQTLKRIGGSRAADVIKAVPGVSIEGGKYVFVRGLGDRYTKTILNNMDIPGLDPDRNTIQMDIFPTNIIENIVVYKAFSPELAADFTGGVVDIITKEFPDEKTFNVSFGFGYNPTQHFNSNYLAGNGSSTDWLGFDNGLRALPIDKTLTPPDPSDSRTNPATGQPYNSELPAITRSFNSNLTPSQTTSPMNFNFSLSAGNQFKPNDDSDWTFGYNFALNYRNSTQFYENVAYNAYVLPSDTDVFELETNRRQEGSLGTNNVLLSGLGGFSAKYKNHKISLNALHIQNGQSSSGIFESETIIDNSVLLNRDNIEYNQRSITNVLLKGAHSFNKGDTKVEWRVAPTVSSIYDKDIRVTPLRYDNEEYSIEPSEGAIPERFWRNLEQTNLTGRLDFTQKLNLFNVENKKSAIKAGLGYTNKMRDYEILSYRILVDGQSQLPNSFVDNGDANLILSDANVWTTDTEIGTYVKGNFEPTNTYAAQQVVMSAYAMGDLVVTPQFRAIIGVRLETFDHIYTGQNNSGSKVFDNQKIIDTYNFLPSVNLVYTVLENKSKGEIMNLRGSFSQTLARPSFKEASIAEIFDAISGRTFIGNIDLVQTQINNFDFRWEYFFNRGESVSVSAFYKMFSNPIELVAYDETAPNNFQPRNVGDATVLGIEVEGKKSLGFISEAFNNFSIGTNVTLVQSEVTMDEATYNSKVQNARTGEVIGRTRPMQGQAPYIINTFLNYVDRENGWEGNVSYNVQGSSLFIVGLALNPDVYTVPFHGLNLKVSKSFGGERQPFKASLRATNILGSERQKVYRTFNAADPLFELLNPGRTFSASLSYKFF